MNFMYMYVPFRLVETNNLRLKIILELTILKVYKYITIISKVLLLVLGDT